MKERCACKGTFFDKLIQPAVLSILAKGPSYGLEILNTMESTNITAGGAPDPAGFYRTLKKMEEEGLMTSEWVEERPGGKMRRMLTLTEEGRHCLQLWRKSLLEYQESIGSLVATIPEETT